MAEGGECARGGDDVEKGRADCGCGCIGAGDAGAGS